VLDALNEPWVPSSSRREDGATRACAPAARSAASASRPAASARSWAAPTIPDAASPAHRRAGGRCGGERRPRARDRS
jgi:hypothetical protein